MRLCHNQRRADVPLVLCLEIKNIKSTSGMFSNTQHDSRWRDNEVTVLVDESQPLWVYNQQFQVLTLVQRSRTAAVNHRVFYLCWIVYTKSCKMIWACCDGPGGFSNPNMEYQSHSRSSVLTVGLKRTPPSVHACLKQRPGQRKLSLHCVQKHNSDITGTSNHFKNIRI